MSKHKGCVYLSGILPVNICTLNPEYQEPNNHYASWIYQPTTQSPQSQSPPRFITISFFEWIPTILNLSLPRASILGRNKSLGAHISSVFFSNQLLIGIDHIPRDIAGSSRGTPLLDRCHGNATARSFFAVESYTPEKRFTYPTTWRNKEKSNPTGWVPMTDPWDGYIYLQEWLIMVNVGIYTIHGSYGVAQKYHSWN